MHSQWPEVHEEQGHTVLKRVYIADMSIQLNPQNPINICLQAVNPNDTAAWGPHSLIPPVLTHNRSIYQGYTQFYPARVTVDSSCSISTRQELTTY